VISSVSGELVSVDEERALLRAGPAVFELLIPAIDGPELARQEGQLVTLYTMFYLQSDGNSFEPVLIGFMRKEDKRFFEKFITVKGIGPRTALRALTISVAQIAAAIEDKDARALTQLKGIGKRTAELIVAELSGKVTEFVGLAVRTPQPPGKRFAAAELDAIETLVVLGERRTDAEQLLQKAKHLDPTLKTTDQLAKAMLRLKQN